MANTASHESAPRTRSKQTDGKWKEVWVEDFKGEFEAYRDMHDFLESLGDGAHVVQGYEDRRKKLVRYPMATYQARQKQIEDEANGRVRPRATAQKGSDDFTDAITEGRGIPIQELPHQTKPTEAVIDDLLNG